MDVLLRAETHEKEEEEEEEDEEAFHRDAKGQPRLEPISGGLAVVDDSPDRAVPSHCRS
jgi:hypothetical protein